jgi:hypothetical protein
VGTAAGLLATGFLASWVEFHTHALTGMESALAAALGLAVIAALREDREVLAGVLLGLAVVNKLDAGLLALAVAVAYVAVLRRPPWRLAGVAAAVTAPWFAFSTAYFGTPLPHSFTQKQSGAVQSTDVPATWILENLRDAQFLPVALLGVAALALVPWVARRSRRAAAALAAVVTWAVLHGLAFSLIDLGDRFPWYLVVLYPALAVGAGCLLGAPVAVARNDSGLALAVVGLAAVSVAALAVGLHRPDGGPPVAVAETLVGGRTMGQYEAFENARREAARQLAERVEPGDVIQTCYGWFAFEAPEAVIDETCPLNTREPVGPPRWLALTTYPGDDPPVGAPLGLDPVITVRSEVGDGGRADVYELPGPGR